MYYSADNLQTINTAKFTTYNFILNKPKKQAPRDDKHLTVNCWQQ